MKALCWYGKGDFRVESVQDPSILDARDIILKITSTAICGSDLHLYGGLIPTMERGDVLGHEPMAEVVEVGSAIRKFVVGDRVVVSFTISCGECFFCRQNRSNPNAEVARKAMGHSPAGLFGYSHMFGGFAGGQAEFLRVPFADVGPIKVPSGVPDDWIQSSTALRSHLISEPIVLTCCARRSCAAARAEQSRFPCVYIGVLDKIPFGAAMNKGLTFVITHKIGLEDAPAHMRRVGIRRMAASKSSSNLDRYDSDPDQYCRAWSALSLVGVMKLPGTQ
jgi:hypothetical protein